MSRNVLESLIIILIALTFGMVLGLPKYQETLSSTEQLEARKADLKNREDYFAALDQIAGEFKNYSENLDKVKSALPIGPSAPALANYLQSISSQSGLILKNLSYGMKNATVVPRDPNTGLAVQDYEVGVTLSGSYPAFKEFLANLEKSRRLVEIQEIAFTVSQASKTAVGAKASVETVSSEGKGENAEPSPEDNKTDQMTYEFNLKLKAHYY